MKPPVYLQALADLCGRYATAFREAWRNRVRQMPDLLPQEAQFLPAALSLQETPLPPAPHVAVGLLTGLLILALIWACAGMVEVVASADGKVVPDERTKLIQSVETATIRAIHVSDGQAVRAGDVLIELDTAAAQADRDRLAGELAAAQLTVWRAQAMLALLAGASPPALPPAGPADDGRQREARRSLLHQFQEYAARLTRINAERSRREAELRTTRELVGKLERTAPLARQRADDFRELAQKNFVSRHAFLDKEQARLEQEGDLASQRSRLQEIEAALREARGQAMEQAAQARSAAQESILDAQQKAASLEQELRKAEARLRMMTLTSPVEGSVQQLAVHTVGGVVTPAQPLMIIVPHGGPLEVEAFIDNKDIGFIRPGQDAEIKVATFPYAKYGTIPARVVSVSHDALGDEKRGLVYSARIRMGRTTVNVDGADVNLSPGMAVTAEIATGRRRLIEYFLSPLMQLGHESLRER